MFVALTQAEASRGSTSTELLKVTIRVKIRILGSTKGLGCWKAVLSGRGVTRFPRPRSGGGPPGPLSPNSTANQSINLNVMFRCARRCGCRMC
jgi:hypothetical protein